MPGLVPGTHGLTTAEPRSNVDGRDEPGHDGNSGR
nr:ABC transporter [Bradyrhizobium cosmicum]